jgi:hypothetical protein
MINASSIIFGWMMDQNGANLLSPLSLGRRTINSDQKSVCFCSTKAAKSFHMILLILARALAHAHECIARPAPRLRRPQLPTSQRSLILDTP